MKKTCIMSLISVMVILAAGCGSSSNLPAISPKTVNFPVVNEIGQSVGDVVTFGWENPDGTTQTWQPQKKTLVAFWIYGCASCLPEIQAVDEFSRESKLDILVINMNRVKDLPLLNDMINQLEEPLTVGMILDPSSDLGRKFGVATVPDAMVIDESGKIMSRQKGRIDLDVLRELENKSEVK
jgi:thiol-disulfide isomerase/thioredoxin